MFYPRCSAGEVGYRMAYTVFGILVPLSVSPLVFTLVLEWREIQRNLIDYDSLGFASPAESRRFGNRSTSALLPKEVPPSPMNDLSETNMADNEFKRSETPFSEKLRTIGRRTCFDLFAEAWNELDVLGLVALIVGATLFLLPLTLAARSPETWKDRKSGPLISEANTLTFGCSVKRGYGRHSSPVPSSSSSLAFTSSRSLPAPFYLRGCCGTGPYSLDACWDSGTLPVNSRTNPTSRRFCR